MPFEQSLPGVHQEPKVQVQNVLDLSVKCIVIGTNTAVDLIADARLDAVGRIRRVPQQIPVTLSRVAVLLMPRLSLSAEACAEEVAVFELFSLIVLPGVPVFDLHAPGLASDPAHAVATEAPLFRDQRIAKRRLVGVVVVVAVGSLPMLRQAGRLAALVNRPHSRPPMKSSKV